LQRYSQDKKFFGRSRSHRMCRNSNPTPAMNMPLKSGFSKARSP
jgi:hypothetical protein